MMRALTISKMRGKQREAAGVDRDVHAKPSLSRCLIQRSSGVGYGSIRACGISVASLCLPYPGGVIVVEVGTWC